MPDRRYPEGPGASFFPAGTRAPAASTLGNAADVALVLPPAREACPHNLAPTTSSLMQLALGGALAVALLESRGFTPIDFGLLHPGGQLGAQLRFARDEMRSDEAVPLVELGTRCRTACSRRRARGLGCIGITGRGGKPVGIVHIHDLLRAGAAQRSARDHERSRLA